ncbi:hypothetical protein ABPG72_013883 [Tetrahymena utriculariae]
MNFEFEGQKYLGIVCTSNQYEAQIASYVYAYAFYSYKNTSSLDYCSNYKGKRFLVGQTYQNPCSEQFNYEDLMKLQSSQVNFLGKNAKQNGLQRRPFIEIQFFQLYSAATMVC